MNDPSFKTDEQERWYNIINGLRGNRVAAIVILAVLILLIIVCVLGVEFGLRLGQMGVGA
jgi:hypothetical protein